MSLEPVYGNSGSDRKWVNNYFDILFNGKELSMAYTKLGQENSFGWNKIKDGLSMQFEELEKRLSNGNIQLLTLGEAGRKFREKYKLTPAAALCADKDTTGGPLRTVWYMSRFYRVNFLYGNGEFHIRDLHLFRDDFREKYLDDTEKTHICFFSNIPLVDGFRFSSKEKTAGAYFKNADDSITFDADINSVVGNDTVEIKPNENIRIKAYPEKLVMESEIKNLTLHFSYVKKEYIDFKIISQNKLEIDYYGHKETVALSSGYFNADNDEFEIIPENGKIVLDF